ncbi:unnamed protein product [Rotaria magnacalcarata]|uniref:Uncharacterized protein n=1 Tax=Rotaria magnacalcarata TaxID=392030 RepID=A0A818YAU4_9BILA|nr:unnamed protein product [Rotaria magnacalcarata]CAF3750209.1 unnamed protein product [Rotaria magnacalcarata]
MNAKHQLNLLLSDILKNESTSTTEFHQGSSTQTVPSLTFAEHDYHPSTIVTQPPSSMVPLPPRRNSSSLKHRRQRHCIYESNLQQQPLLNSSTLDDLFRALTLECEQYLAASSTSSYPNKIYDKLIVQPSTTIQKNVDSNDDDYENLHASNLPLSNGISTLKTSIEVMSPAKRQVVSISVSSKISSSPIVSSSKTYPSLSTSCTTTSNIPPAPATNYYSSEDDSMNVSSSSTTRKRRRRIRKHQIISSTTRSSSSSDEPTEIPNGFIQEKKLNGAKRSYSTDYRQQRIKSIYDNQPITLSTQKCSTRRVRRRDISLQQHPPFPTKYEDISTHFPENICSPLSVLLTSARTASDFVDRSQQQMQQRRSRLELVHPQPLTLLDRLHNQFYRASPTHNNNNNNNIPTHRIPSYPVY